MIGVHLHNARTYREKPMSQQDLALAAGLSVAQISRIERGQNTNPRLSTLRKLCRALDASLVVGRDGSVSIQRIIEEDPLELPDVHGGDDPLFP